MAISYIEKVQKELLTKYPEQKEYLQATKEVLDSLEPLFARHPEYEELAILERLVEPDRIISFKVPLEMDDHRLEVYTGYRIQYSNVVGPYKGGLRFNRNVNLSVLKFLGFEQVFKNALTGLPMGGSKGGSNFDPKGKSENEIMRFCQSFMMELYKYIGPDVDIPAGDMGVSSREIGYLYGTYRRLTSKAELGTITGKGLSYGGCLIRKEATGYGLIYFVEEILKKLPISKPRVIISGSGNVAIYACQKAQQLGYQVIGMSDSKGYILDENINLEVVKQIKEVNRGSLIQYPELSNSGAYFEGSIYDDNNKVDIVLPCGTQNEIDLLRAQRLYKNGVKIVAEGANMPNNSEAIKFYQEHDIIFVPGKASNAGGVSTSCIEMQQNASHTILSEKEVDDKLHQIMIDIYCRCQKACRDYDIDENDFVSGANLAAASKVIDAMISQGY